MRVLLTGCAIVVLAACQPRIPDSAAGVGFDNATLSPNTQPKTAIVSPIPEADAVSQETLASSSSTTRTTSQTSSNQPLATTATATPPAASTAATTTVAAASSSSSEPAAPSSNAAGQPQTTPDGIVHASPSNPAPVLMNNPGISDENNFDAVGSRRTIEDDAARIANNRANYEVIQPTAVPKRTETGPNVVAFALSTKHPVGAKTYSRLGLTSQSRSQKACAKYASSSEAQIAFLSRGGPKNDRLGLDPDGDGYACGWDPSPYRQAARN